MSVLKKRSVQDRDTSQIERDIIRRLHYYHELDTWQQDNHYIRSGYVKETSSYSDCWASLFYLHNEWGNVISHLIPAIAAAFMVRSYMKLSVDPDSSLWVKLNFVQFGVGASVCLYSSSLFHLFKSHSWRVCKFGNQCDYFGIVIMITTSLISIIVFAMDDEPRWRNFFVTLFLVFGSILTKVTFDVKFSTPAYRPIRSALFVLYGLSGVLPVIASIWLFGAEEAEKRSSAGFLVLEGVFYISGAVIYSMRIPERFVYSDDPEKQKSDGLFDIFGHSHQIFHVMVVIAAWCHWIALRNCYSDWLARNY